MQMRRLIAFLLFALVALLAPGAVWATELTQGIIERVTTAPPAPLKQSQADADRKSGGCLSCHTTTDSLTMHTSPGVTLGCADCHGGNAGVFVPAGAAPGSPEYRHALDAAHVQPRNPAAWSD